MSRGGRAVTVQKCTKKRDARAELLYCWLMSLLFWRSRRRRRRGYVNMTLHVHHPFEEEEEEKKKKNGSFNTLIAAWTELLRFTMYKGKKYIKYNYKKDLHAYNKNPTTTNINLKI